MTKKSTKKTLARASKAQDKAQNKMLADHEKQLAAMKASIEKKYSYVSNVGVSIQPWDPATTASRSQNIFPIRIGSTQGIKDIDQRIGDVVTLKSINLSYVLMMKNGAAVPADPYNRIRVVLFWDTDPVSTTTAGAYVLDTPEWNLMFQTPSLLTAAGNENVVISPRDHDTGKRFQMLFDRTHTLSANENANLTATPSQSLGLGPRSVTGVEYVNKSYKVGKKLRYKDAGVIPINRALYLGFISDSFGVANPSVNYTIKCNYEDA